MGRVENIVQKEENAGYQHFLLFLQCLQKSPIPEVLKVEIVWHIVNICMMDFNRWTWFCYTVLDWLNGVGVVHWKYVEQAWMNRPKNEQAQGWADFGMNRGDKGCGYVLSSYTPYMLTT